MSKSKIKRSVVFPLVMLAYLAVMAWLGRDRLERGEHFFYYGVIGVSLVIIVLLFFSLRKKEKLRERREKEQYGTYDDKTKGEDQDPDNE